MKKRLICFLGALALAACIPCTVFADDSTDTDTVTISTAESAEALQGISDDLSGAIDQYDGGFDSAFAEVKQAWDDTIFGPVRFAAFSADLIGDVYDAFPAYKFYIILLFIVIPVAALVRIFIKA